MTAPETILHNRYRIVRQIGQGGMSAVYLAVDEKFNAPIALKENTCEDDGARRAFEREAVMLYRLRHPALPRVIDHFTEGQTQFLVMEFIAGDDFGTILQKRFEHEQPRGRPKPFETDTVLKWADQLLDALDYLHTHQPPVIHRDIKPQNLKLGERDQIILLDFGLAKGSAMQISRIATSRSVFGYTPSYAPIEQIQGTGTDPRSDLYSFGATLYCLLTGQAPVDALTRATAVLEGSPDPLVSVNQLNPTVPIAVAQVLMSALALNRHQRPASAAQMRESLRAATISESVTHRREPDRQTQATLPDTVLPSPPSEAYISKSFSGDELATRMGKVVEPPPPTMADTVPFTPYPAATKREIARKAGLIIGGISFMALIVITTILDSDLRNSTEGAATRNSSSPVTANANIASPSSSKQDNASQPAYTETVNGVAIEMVRIPGGTFMMGSPADEAGRDNDEGPQHQVTVSSFYMSKFEVTQAQWRAVARLFKVKIDLDSDPSGFKGDNLPVEQVSWEDAVEFCERLSRATGKTYRLPTEAEWEYACRAGTSGAYAGNIDSMAWVDSNSGDKTHPVGAKQPNAFGLYDMHGNVWELCFDMYSDNYYSQSQGVNPTGPNTGSIRVRRGGCYGAPVQHSRSARRGRYEADRGHTSIGFRLVRTLN